MTDFHPVLDPALDEPRSSSAQPSVGSLVAGIVSDVRDLLEQQFALIRYELQQDMQKTCRATWLIAIGACSGLIAGIGLFLAVAHCLSWVFPNIPLWGCFGMVGMALFMVAAGMIYWGIKVFDSLTLRLNGSSQTMKEHR